MSEKCRSPKAQEVCVESCLPGASVRVENPRSSGETWITAGTFQPIVACSDTQTSGGDSLSPFAGLTRIWSSTVNGLGFGESCVSSSSSLQEGNPSACLSKRKSLHPHLSTLRMQAQCPPGQPLSCCRSWIGIIHPHGSTMKTSVKP